MFSWTWIIIAALLIGLMAAPWLMEGSASAQAPAAMPPDDDGTVLPHNDLRFVRAMHIASTRRA